MRWLACGGAVAVVLATWMGATSFGEGADEGTTVDAIEMGGPVKLTPDGNYGYEPGIAIGPDGTLYATAHKASLTNEDTRLSSWLWYSRDDGATWAEMPSPAQAHDKMFAFEGDIAIDALGRIYFVDTWLADNTLSRWSTGVDGPVWDFSRPIQGSTAVDDRPWLAAQGDGIVYYIGNSGVALPAPNNLLEDCCGSSRYWFYRSIDGGLTWSEGHGFSGSGWCGIAASPVNDVTVVVLCTMGLGNNADIVAFVTHDRGDSWSDVRITGLAEGQGPGFPSVDFDAAGNLFGTWVDDNLGDDDPGRVRVARSFDGAATWSVQSVQPFVGSFGHSWISAGPTGVVAVTYHASPDTDPDGETPWFMHVSITTTGTAATPLWTAAQVDPEPVVLDNIPPEDFHENAVGPDGAVRIVYQRTVGVPLETDPTRPGAYNNDILFVRQVGGANLANEG